MKNKKTILIVAAVILAAAGFIFGKIINKFLKIKAHWQSVCGGISPTEKEMWRQAIIETLGGKYVESIESIKRREKIAAENQEQIKKAKAEQLAYYDSLTNEELDKIGIVRYWSRGAISQKMYATKEEYEQMRPYFDIIN